MKTMEFYDALEGALRFFNCSDEKLKEEKYTLHIQVDGLLLKKLVLESGKKSVEDFAIDCIMKGLKDE